VEQVFEKNVGQFNNLMTHSDAAKQLENVQQNVKKIRSKPKKQIKARVITADELEDDE
jgi:F0F1-type ATP synthase delta subunit